MANSTEMYLDGHSTWKEKQEQLAKERERKREKFILKSNKFVSDKLFKTQRDGSFSEGTDDVSVTEITEEIENIYLNYFKDEADEEKRKDRTLEIDFYMSDYGIFENVCNYLKDEPINYMLEGIDGNGIKNRMYNLFNQIRESNGAETLTLDAFFANRMAKIIEQIMLHYCGKKFHTLYERFCFDKEISKISEEEIFDMPDEKLEALSNWFNSKENSNLTQNKQVSDFVAYLKLRTIQNRLYEEKDKDMIQLCKQYPELVRDYTKENDKDTLLYIRLENYALPVGLHIPKETFKSELKNQEIRKPTQREFQRTLQSFPIKLKPSELTKFNEFLENYYRQNEQGKFFDDEQVEPSIEEHEIKKTTVEGEKQKSNLTEIKESEEKDQQNQQEQQNQKEQLELQESQETQIDERKEVRKGKQQYKSDEETLLMVNEILDKNNIIDQIPSEYIEKLYARSKCNKTKLEKVFIDIKKFIEEKGFSGDESELKATKMFCYTKILDRGFWNTSASKRQEVYEKQFKEVEAYSDEFFRLMAAGVSLEDIKNQMNDISGYKKLISGARTLKEKKTTKEVIVEDISEEKLYEESGQEQSHQIEGKVDELEFNNETAEVNSEKTELDIEIELLNEEYDRLEERKMVLEQRKQKLNDELEEIINDTESLEERRIKIINFFSNENMEFVRKVVSEQKIEEARNKLKMVEEQIEQRNNKKEENEDESANIDKELEEIEEKKNKIKEQMDHMIDDL